MKLKTKSVPFNLLIINMAVYILHIAASDTTLGPMPHFGWDYTHKLDFNEDGQLALDTLEKWTNFIYTHLDLLDTTLYFGVFVAKAFIRIALLRNVNELDESRPGYRRTLSKIFDNLTYVERYFSVKAANDKNKKNDRARKLLSLMTHEHSWTGYMALWRPFEAYDWNAPLDMNDYLWSHYKANVMNLTAMDPTPAEAERCMLDIANTEYNYPGHKMIPCYYTKFTTRCRSFLRHGTNYGFGLTHRLLVLIMARYGRFCHVLEDPTSNADHGLGDALCRYLLEEAKFMEHPQGKFYLKLYLEQAAFCSIWLDDTILTKRWLMRVLKYQDAELGCFKPDEKSWNGDVIQYQTTFPGWPMLEDQFGLFGGKCNRHITAMAGIVFAAAIRYAVEYFHKDKYRGLHRFFIGRR